jgi:hypothetical protein
MDRNESLALNGKSEKTGKSFVLTLSLVVLIGQGASG